MIRNLHPVWLSLSSGIILFLAWPPLPLAFLTFIGFVPILLIEQRLFEQQNPKSNSILFRWTYLAFLIWNIGSTWWVWNASAGGAVMAIVANSLLMTFPIVLFHITRKNLGDIRAYIGLMIYWLSFEYIHHSWELTWPWLSLGNSMASFPELIQWYEFTGMSGGTLWILLMNILILRAINQTSTVIRSAFQIGTVMMIPVIISLILWNTFEEQGQTKEIVVVQPNIDPYNDKFDGSSSEQIDAMLKLAEEKLSSTTDYLVLPETAIPTGIWMDRFEEVEDIKKVRLFLKKYPDLTLVTGISAYAVLNLQNLTPSARTFTDGRCCWDAYNTAIQMDSDTGKQIYHKSKLVPGVERIPYPQLLKPLESLAIDMGGITGSLGIMEERVVFKSKDGTGVAPVICYESVFGEFMTEYIRKGADMIFIITNDGWWGDTPGYKQHKQYAALRAIETRTPIARSANTGISCFISAKGEITQETGWWVPAVIKGQLKIGGVETFFARYGDYLGRVSSMLSVIMLLLVIVSIRTGKFKHRVTKL